MRPLRPQAVAELFERLYGMQYAMWGLLRDRWGTDTPTDRDRLRSFMGEMARTALLGPLPVVRTGSAGSEPPEWRSSSSASSGVALAPTRARADSPPGGAGW
jgi:hypothetical protein